MKSTRPALPGLFAGIGLLCAFGCQGVAVLAPQGHNATHQSFLSTDAVSELHTFEEDGPYKPDYNKETYLPHMPVSVEMVFALLFVALVGSVPFVIVVMIGGGNMTKAHIIESVALVVWLLGAIFMFCSVLKFNSSHWSGSRSLTIVEAVYLLSQILTTVGYGDITPAFPKGQVLVAVNVLVALCLYGSIIMEVTELLSSKLGAALSSEEEEAEESASGTPRGSMPLKCWDEDHSPVSLMHFAKSLGAFFVLATIGVIFYHFFPGEGKTWLQAVYMSVITLSTVGFGWFNAVTEAGKVFGAFWMLFGVAALAATITSFCEYMEKVKAKQRKNTAADKLDFYKWATMYTRTDTSCSDKGMDSYDFMKFGLVLNGFLSEEELEHIEARFQSVAGGREVVEKQAVFEAESPPASFHSKHEAAMKKEGRLAA